MSTLYATMIYDIISNDKYVYDTQKHYMTTTGRGDKQVSYLGKFGSKRI